MINTDDRLHQFLVYTGATVSRMNTATFAQLLPWSKITTLMGSISDNPRIFPIFQPLTIIFEPLTETQFLLCSTTPTNLTGKDSINKIVILNAHLKNMIQLPFVQMNVH